MSKNYDMGRIKQFLVEKIDLIIFCDYLLDKIQKIRNIRPLDLDYMALAGNKLKLKVISLTTEIVRLGWLADFIFILTNFWLENGGSKREICDAGIHQDLRIASQELWRENELRELATEAFNCLAELHEGFKREWEKTQQGEMLKNVANLGEYESVEELTALLQKCREQYETVINHIKNHQLLDARNAFIELDQLLPGYGEDSKHLDYLKSNDEIRKLQTVIDAAELGFAYDHRLPGETENPYRLFRQLGVPITPDSSNEMIQEELQKLKKQEGEIPEDKRNILEILVNNTDDRLFVDALFYPYYLARATISAVVNNVFEKGQWPTPGTIVTKNPGESAVLLFLMGRYQDAAEMWKKTLLQQPLEGQNAHCLGLLYLGLVNDMSNTDPGRRLQHRQAAIAHWAMALVNTAYWAKWGRERCDKYNLPFVFASIDTLINKIRSYLGRFLDRGDNIDNVMPTPFNHFKLDLDIEFEAASLANSMGGIPLGQGRLAWFGPLGMAIYQWENHLVNFISAFPTSSIMDNSLSGNVSPGDVLRRLRWYFSYLRIPAIWVEGPGKNPGEALKYLDQPGENQGEDCGDINCPLHGQKKYPVLVYCPAGEQFQVKNPAYKDQTNAGELMADDALHLAIAAHAALALVHIHDRELKDPNSLQNHWEEILILAQYSKNPGNVREGIRSLVLEETFPLPTDKNRMDTAITITDICLKTLTENYKNVNQAMQEEEPLKNDPLKKRLAELLAARGMRRLEQENVPAAEADLVWALNTAPDIHHIRINLATLWYNQSIRVIRFDSFLSQDYLRRAEELVKTGKEKYPGFDYGEIMSAISGYKEKLSLRKPYSTTEDDTTDSVDSKETDSQQPPQKETSDITKLYSQGVRELREGRPDVALNTFKQALDKSPDDIEIQKEIPRALMEHAMRLIEKNKHEEALNQVRGWIPRLPTQKERVERQLEFLNRWPYIQPCLQEANAFTNKVLDYQEVRLLSLDQGLADQFLSVRVQAEGAYLALTSPMPLFSESEGETALKNLLQATNDIMFKLTYSEKNQLVLKCLAPFRLLEPGWFNHAAFDLFKFSDISSKQILKIDTLRAHFREIEAASLQRHQNAHLSASIKALLKICQEQGRQFMRITDTHYTLDEGKLVMKAQTNGTRLFITLGQIRPSHDRQFGRYERVVSLNAAAAQPCKLSLDLNMNVILSIEWPYLDEPAVEEALGLLEEKAGELAPKLVE